MAKLLQIAPKCTQNGSFQQKNGGLLRKVIHKYEIERSIHVNVMRSNKAPISEIDIIKSVKCKQTEKSEAVRKNI